MDTITQGLLGAATAQLGFRQRIGRDATWVAAAAAVVPDLDIFIAPLLSLTGIEAGDLAQQRFHRGLTHSLLFAPVLSLPIALLWRRLRRKALAVGRGPGRAHGPPLRLLYACVLLAVFTHPLLDWCTSYGTRLLEPLTDARYAIDAAPIIDLIYTPLLVLTLLGCWLARKVARRRGGAEADVPARADPAPRATLAIGWVGFAISVGYLAAGRLLHDRAIDRAAGLVAAERGVRANAYPALGSIFLWRVVFETDAAWHAVRVHQFSGAPPEAWRHTRVAKAAPNRWIEKAQALEEYRTYRWFAGGRVRAEYERMDGLHVVGFHDMRYSGSSDGVESLWPLVVQFHDDGRVLLAERRHPRRARFGQYAAALWHDLWDP